MSTQVVDVDDEQTDHSQTSFNEQQPISQEVIISTTNSDDFNFMRTLNAFKACITNDGMDVDLPKFIFAYREFIKFVDMLGRMFGFVSWELNDKCGRVENCMLSEPSEYTTVSNAIEYEKIQGIHRVNKNASISLLRLHRGLDLIRRLVENCYSNLESKRKLSELAYEAYEQTLAFRHKWAIRHLVRVGVHFLPNKHDLMDMILKSAPPCENGQERDSLMYEYMSAVDRVHGVIYKIYEQNDFLELVFV